MAYQFFITDEFNELVLSADDVFHLTKVLRIRPGEKLELVSKTTRYYVTVTNINPINFNVDAQILLPQKNKPLITLFYALPKGDKLDLVVQKAVELSVDQLVIVESHHCVTRYSNDKKGTKMARLAKIIKSAAMQSKQDFIPTLRGPLPFSEALKLTFPLKLIAHEKASLPLAKTLKDFPTTSTLSVLVGPEGGFSEEEVALAAKHGYHIVSFGKNVLRSETAALYALSVLHHYKEGLNDENI